MKHCVNTACSNYGTRYTDDCGKPRSYMLDCKEYLAATRTDSSGPFIDGLVGLTDLAHEMGMLVKGARKKERDGQIEAEAYETAESRVLIKIEKLKREQAD